MSVSFYMFLVVCILFVGRWFVLFRFVLFCFVCLLLAAVVVGVTAVVAVIVLVVDGGDGVVVVSAECVHSQSAFWRRTKARAKQRL